MGEAIPWGDEAWCDGERTRIAAELDAVGHPVHGEIERVKAWGRAVIFRAPTADDVVWIKYSYRLPPGEERVLAPLADRWPGRVPTVVATWPGAVAMATFSGQELLPESPRADWIATAQVLGEVAAGERAHVDEWVAGGVRDRRPSEWPAAVEELAASPVVSELEDVYRRRLAEYLPDFIERYVDGFACAATLIHQDSGCCNVVLGDEGPLVFDWSDVVVGHPTFSCDRLLDQVPKELHDDVIDAFAEPLALTRDEFRAMRRSNVLHEVLRYHDELEYLAADDPTRGNLANSVRSQLRVLIDFEEKRGV